jgi:hypothetical protein
MLNTTHNVDNIPAVTIVERLFREFSVPSEQFKQRLASFGDGSIGEEGGSGKEKEGGSIGEEGGSGKEKEPPGVWLRGISNVVKG